MSFIDPRTVILLGGIMSGLMSLVLYSLKRSYPSSIKGLGEWSAALLFVFFGTVLATAGDDPPVFVSISLARLLVAMGLYLSYAGTQRFFGGTPRMGPWIALIAGVILVQVWFTFVNPIYQVRLAAANILAGWVFGLHAYLVLKQGSFTFAKVLAIIVLALMSAIQFMRLASSLVWSPGNDMFDTSPQHLIYIASFVFCILLLSVSLMMMATDRLRTELEHLATHDSLTNALTRRHMNEACEKELERCRRHGHSMALLLLDMDHFKAVNDTYGHQTGDRLLISFVEKTNALLRRPDHLGRFGGEEFVALLPDTSLAEATQVAERIREVCAQRSAQPSCTVSIGVTTNQKDSDTVDKILARADAAMYRAKANGRNRVETA